MNRTRKMSKQQQHSWWKATVKHIWHKNKGSVKGIWDKLRKVHEQANLSDKLFPLHKLYSAKLEDETQRNLLHRYLVKQLCGIGIIQDDHIAVLIFNGLCMSYNTLITALEARPATELMLEYVKNKTINESARQKEKGQ